MARDIIMNRADGTIKFVVDGSMVTGTDGLLQYDGTYFYITIGSTRLKIMFTNTVPSVTTDLVSLQYLTTATCGGNVTDSGSAYITARGVCWNTGGSPTISDSKTTDESGVGTFTSSLTSLSPGTLYYVRAYATNSIGTGYGNQQSFTTLASLTIGNTYQGGIVFYITAPTAGATSGTAGIISKTADMAGTGQWGCYGTAISGADGTAIGTGNQNTIDIHNAACAHVSTAANYCYDLTDGTYSDWFLPSYNELNLMIMNGFWTSSEINSNQAYRVYTGMLAEECKMWIRTKNNEAYMLFPLLKVFNSHKYLELSHSYLYLLF